MTVSIQQADLNRLTELTEACWPEEACALIVGHHLPRETWVVSHIEPSINIAVDPSRFFEIDPALRIKVEMNTLSEDHEIIGIFHSHPEGEPVLSETDITNIKEPNLFWLIASTASGKVNEFRAFISAGNYEIDQLTLQATDAASGD